jgi:hypothetical protein
VNEPSLYLAALVCVGLYLLVGLVLCLAIDNSPRHGGAVRDMPWLWEVFTLAAWPLVLPLLLWANPERRR